MSGPTAPEPTLHPAYVGAKLWANRRVIVLIPLLLAAAGLLYTFLAAPQYRAETTLYFPTRPSNLLGSIGVTQSDSPGGLSSLSTGPSPIKIFRRFLESETCLEMVSQQSGLKNKKIVDSRQVTEDPGAGMLTLAVTLPDADQAKLLLNQHLKALSSINSRIADSYLADDTSAIQNELATQKQKLSDAQEKLVQFQQHANSAPSTSGSQWQARLLQAQVDLSSTRSSLKAASAIYSQALGSKGLSPTDIPPVQKLRPRLVDAEYQLNALSATLGPDAPEVRHLNTEIATIKDELKSEVSAYVSSVHKGLIDPTGASQSSTQNVDVSGMLGRQVALEAQIEALSQLAKVAPAEEGTLAKLALQVSIQSELVKQATTQLEAARLQSLRDPNKWSLLDAPWVDPKPVNKKYLQVGAVAVLAGLLFASVWAINFGRRPSGE